MPLAVGINQGSVSFSFESEICYDLLFWCGVNFMIFSLISHQIIPEVANFPKPWYG